MTSWSYSVIYPYPYSSSFSYSIYRHIGTNFCSYFRCFIMSSIFFYLTCYYFTSFTYSVFGCLLFVIIEFYAVLLLDSFPLCTSPFDYLFYRQVLILFFSFILHPTAMSFHSSTSSSLNYKSLSNVLIPFSFNFSSRDSILT